jgi:hypothetical protein
MGMLWLLNAHIGKSEKYLSRGLRRSFPMVALMDESGVA